MTEAVEHADELAHDQRPALTAEEVGRSLNSFLKASRYEPDQAELERIVCRLASAECSTPADILALLTWSDEYARVVIATLDANREDADLRTIWQQVTWSRLLNMRALEALERAARRPSTDFLGAGPTLN